MNEEMKPTQALDIIDKVLANVSGTRQDHVLLIQALEVLKKCVKDFSVID